MIKKRAHKLRYKFVVSSEGYLDGFDNWVPGSKVEETVEVICRADVNSNGRTVPNDQGQNFVYSFAIYLDRIPDNLTRGTHIEILNGDKVIGDGPVVFPFGYQATNKLWV